MYLVLPQYWARLWTESSSDKTWWHFQHMGNIRSFRLCIRVTLPRGKQSFDMYDHRLVPLDRLLELLIPP